MVQFSASTMILASCALVTLLPGRNARHPVPQEYPEMIWWPKAVSTYGKKALPGGTSWKVGVPGVCNSQPSASTTILHNCPRVVVLYGLKVLSEYPETTPAQ